MMKFIILIIVFIIFTSASTLLGFDPKSVALGLLLGFLAGIIFE